MKFATFIFSARFWLTLFVSLAVTIGAASADIHPLNADEAACEIRQMVHHVDANLSDFTDNLSDPYDDDHERNHDHHVHHCGSCHVHSLRWENSSLNLRDMTQEKFSLLISINAPRRAPSDLFRPPRA